MKPLWALFGLALLSGCASSPSLYSWGHYEDLIYESYSKPGAVSPEKQIELLEKDYQKARAKNKSLPPGWHAHLGYMYYQLGKLDEARQHFETEKTSFPESTIYMDRLLSRFQTR